MLKLLWNILLAWFSHSILWWRKNLSETIFGMKFQVSFAKMFFLCNVVLCWSYYAYPIVYFSEERICSKVFFEWNFQVVLLKQGEKFFFSINCDFTDKHTLFYSYFYNICHHKNYLITLYRNYFENRQKMRQWRTPISSKEGDNILSFHGLNIISNVMVQMKEQS